MKNTHNYAYIRLVGNIWTGDFITIGALSLSDICDINLEFKDIPDTSKKVMVMFGSECYNHYIKLLDDLKGDINHWKGELTGNDKNTYREWFIEYVKPREGIIQYSGICTGIYKHSQNYMLEVLAL